MGSTPADQEVRFPIASVSSGELGTLGNIFATIANWLKSIRDFFWDVADTCGEWLFVGGVLSTTFDSIGDIFDGFYRSVDNFSTFADDIDDKILDILSWDNISDKISIYLFDGKSPMSYIADSLTGWYDDNIKPTFDTIGDNIAGFFTYIDTAIDNLDFPSFDDVGNAIKDAITEIDLPSWDDVPWIGDLKIWFDDVEWDVKDFFSDPAKFIGGYFSGLLLSFVQGSATLLIGIIEAFLDKIWDGYGDSE